MYLNFIFRFVRGSMIAVFMAIVLTAAIMFIWLSLVPPVEITTEAKLVISEGQYVFAVFKESIKYSLLLMTIFYIADRSLRRNAATISTVKYLDKNKKGHTKSVS